MLAFAHADLVERLNDVIGPQVALGKDRLHVDAEHFWRSSIRQVGANEEHVAERSAGSEAASALEQIHDPLGSLVGHGTLETVNLAD